MSRAAVLAAVALFMFAGVALAWDQNTKDATLASLDRADQALVQAQAANDHARQDLNASDQAIADARAEIAAARVNVDAEPVDEPPPPPPPPTTFEPTWERQANFESGNFSEIDFGWRNSPSATWGTTISTAQGGAPDSGTQAVRTNTNGGGGCCSYSRGVFEPITGTAGSDVSFGMSYFIPETTTLHSNTRLMGLRAFPDPVQSLAFNTLNSGGTQATLQTVAEAGGSETLCTALTLPEGRWFRLVVTVDNLSQNNGVSTTRCYLDGVEYDNSTQRTMVNGNSYDHVQYGLGFWCPTQGDCTVNAGAGTQASFWFDRFGLIDN